MFKRSKNKKDVTRRPNLNRQTANVFSYHASRSSFQANLGRHEQQETSSRLGNINWGYLPTWLAVVLIIVSLFYIGTLAPQPKLALINSSGSFARPASTYQAYIDQVMQSSISSKTKLTIDTDAFADQIQQQFPEVDKVSVTVPLIARRPVVQLEVARPAFILDSMNGGAYYIRTDGTASVKLDSSNNAASAGLLAVTDESGLPVASGKQVLPASTVQFITEVVRQLQAKQVGVGQMVLPAIPNELQVHLSGAPYYVVFDTTGDAQLQAGMYLAAAQKLTDDQVTPKQYVDVRVAEKVYYK